MGIDPGKNAQIITILTQWSTTFQLLFDFGYSSEPIMTDFDHFTQYHNFGAGENLANLVTRSSISVD